MSELPEPRIADVDRGRVSKHLRVAYGEGRITEIELEERLTVVYEARTASELEVVIVDLPTPPSAAVQSSPVARARSSFDLRPAAPLLLPSVVCTLIYLMTIPGGYFWPMWVWLGCGVAAALVVFGSGQSDDDSGPSQVPPSAQPQVGP